MTSSILKRSGAKTQILCCLGANCLCFIVGISIASSSVIIARLTDDSQDEDLKATKEEASWIASSTLIGQFIAALTGGYIIEKIGLQKSMTVDGVMFIIGLLGQSVAINVPLICTARIFLGYGNILSSMIISPFVCEISHPDLRSYTTSFQLASYSVGFTSMFLLGASLPWRISVGLPIILGVAAIVGFQFIHDSPARLLLRGEMETAKKAAEFYGLDIQGEILEMERHAAKTQIQDDPKTSLRQKLLKVTDVIKKTNFYKPLTLLLVLIVAIEWTSFPVLAFYMVTIFKLTGAPFDPFWASSVAAICRSISALSATGLLGKFNRRVLYISAAASIAFWNLTMAVYTYFNTSGYFVALDPQLVSVLGWTPLILVIMLYISFACGFGNIPYILLGEILPQEHCNLGISIVFIFQNTFSFLMTKSAPSIIDAIGIHGLFLLFSCVAALVCIYSAIFMKETKGLSLKEIRAIYNKDQIILDIIKEMEEMDDHISIKWDGAGGRRRTISINI